MKYEFTIGQLKALRASQFAEGDTIWVSKYVIHIKYNGFPTPALATTVLDRHKVEYLDCTPGAGTPYYVDDFKNK